MSSASVRACEFWVFDLDNTLYPADSTVYDAIGARMTQYVARVSGLDFAAAETLQERYFLHYGATVVGLMRHHAIDAAHFMHEVHDVDLSIVPPDPELNALIAELPGRKYVFTNGGAEYARRMVKQLGLQAHFDGIVDIETTGLVPKPDPEAYRHLVDLHGIDPARAVLIEDTLRNLEPAYALGFETVLVGHVHPDPKPHYLDHTVRDLKSFLRSRVQIDRTEPAA